MPTLFDFSARNPYRWLSLELWLAALVLIGVRLFAAGAVVDVMLVWMGLTIVRAVARILRTAFHSDRLRKAEHVWAQWDYSPTEAEQVAAALWQRDRYGLRSVFLAGVVATLTVILLAWLSGEALFAISIQVPLYIGLMLFTRRPIAAYSYPSYTPHEPTGTLTIGAVGAKQKWKIDNRAYEYFQPLWGKYITAFIEAADTDEQPDQMPRLHIQTRHRLLGFLFPITQTFTLPVPQQHRAEAERLADQMREGWLPVPE